MICHQITLPRFAAALFLICATVQVSVAQAYLTQASPGLDGQVIRALIGEQNVTLTTGTASVPSVISAAPPNFTYGTSKVNESATNRPPTIALLDAASSARRRATLTSIAVTPANGSIPLGTTQQFAATGQYSDGSTENITSTVTWRSSARRVTTISSAGLASALAIGSVTITASSGTLSGETTLTVSPAALVSLSVTPASASIPLGTTQQFGATGTYTNGSTQNVTSLVTWTSSAPSVSTINATALATSTGTGATNILASTGSISSPPASLTVLPAVLQSIAITPANSSIALGTTQQLTATGTFSDGSTQNISSTVTWSSSAGTVAAISAAGVANSAAVGTTTISATSGSVVGSTMLTVSPAQLVSIAITPAIPSIPLGTEQQFAATGTFTDGSTQNLTATVQWSSSAATVATIGDSSGTNGLASGLAMGTTNITATSGSISGSTTLTVTADVLSSIAITPAEPSIASGGTTQQFTATGWYTDSTTQDVTSASTWSSSVTAVATVNSAGMAQSAATGSTTITASDGNINGATTLTVTAAALVSITVEPATASIPLGTTQPFTATGNYADGSTQTMTSAVYWSSSDGAVATISNATGTVGLSSSVAAGSATISATSGSISGTASLSITPPTLVSISITPQTPSIALGASQQFTATGTYSDESTQNITTNVTWTSSSATVAVISNNTGSQGLATSSGVGTATITAALGPVSASTSLVVGCITQLRSIAVTPADPTILIGGNLQFMATGSYTGGCTANLTNSVTWSSSNAGVITINNSGDATGVAQGSATITAGLGAISGSTTSVTEAVLVSIAVTPAKPSIVLGNSQQFTATGTYNNGSTQNLTGTATWSSSSPGVATMSTTGLATSVSAGSTTITAAMGSISGSTTLSVTAGGGVQETLVQHKMSLISNCSGLTCTVTLPAATGAGHVLMLGIAGAGVTGVPIAGAPSGDSTWTHCPNGYYGFDNAVQGNDWPFTDCFYILSAAGGATSISVAFTGTTGLLWMNLELMEVSCPGCTASYDTSNFLFVPSCTADSPCDGEVLSLAGSNDAILQIFNPYWEYYKIAAPYSLLNSDNNSGNAFAYVLNYSSGAPAIWEQGGEGTEWVETSGLAIAFAP